MKQFFLSAGVLLFVMLFCRDQRSFIHYGVDEGLSQGSVFGLIQDNQGFIWVGTADGLNRFDGYSFKTFIADPKDSLAMHHPHIRGIYSGTNAVWVTTSSSMELYRLDLVTQKIQHIYTCPDTGVVMEMSVFREDPDGVWIITSTRGIIKYDWKQNKIIKSFPQVVHAFPSPSAMTYDSATSQFWYVAPSHGGLNSFNLKTEEFHHYGFSDTIIQNGPELHSVAIGRNGVMWIGGENCLVEYHPREGVYTKYNLPGDSVPPGIVLGMLQVDDNSLWCGTDRGNLFRFDCTNKTFSAEDNPADGSTAYRITILMADRTRNIWVGTDPYGLYKIDTKRKPFHHVLNNPADENSLKNNFTKCFLQENNTMYVGLYNNGISAWNRNTNTFHNIHGFAGETNTLPTVSCIAPDSGGVIWVSTSQGVGMFDTVSYALRRPQVAPLNAVMYANCNTVLPLNRDTVFVGIDNGLYQLARAGNNWTITTFNVQRNVERIFSDRENRLWVAAFDGLYFSPDHNAANLKLLISDAGRAKSVTQTNDGFIWAATETGVVKIDPVSLKELRHYGMNDGMPNSFTYGILPDANGNLWISTNKGICMFDPSRENFRNYSVSDGLQSNEFNTGAYYVNGDGEFFFGGVNGFNYFRPAEITDNPFAPQCVITGFSIFDKPLLSDSTIEYRKHIKLNYEQNNLLIEYTALEFSDPAKNSYRYRMLGVDTQWTDAGKERFARFVNVDPGEYVFELKAANNDGLWNDQPLRLYISITPPFWKTMWFIIAALATGILLVVLGIRFYFRRQLKIKTREMQLKQSVRMNAIFETEENERKRIAGELHDGLGQLLSTAKLNVAGFGENIDPKDSVLLNNSLQLLDQACEEVRTISHNMMPGALIRMGLIAAVNELIIKINDTEKLKVEFDTEIEGRFNETVEIALYRIIQEALNNMVRHSEAKNITVQIKHNSSSLEVSISDDGKGFDVSRIAESDGLGWKNMYSRVETLNGTIRVESTPGQGTAIFISIPLQEP